MATEPGPIDIGGRRIVLERGRYGNPLPKGYGWYHKPSPGLVLHGEGAVTGFSESGDSWGRVSEYGGLYVLPHGILVTGHNCSVGNRRLDSGSTHILFLNPGQVALERVIKRKLFGGEKFANIRFFTAAALGGARIRVGGILAENLVKVCDGFETMRRQAGMDVEWTDAGNGRQTLGP